MKTVDRILDVESTLDGERVEMSIEQSALAHIMSVLTDLYSDPMLAVIREYSTNAFDAHVEAGVTRPIEVTLPTNVAPYLIIRDYGEGLDAEGIREIYSRYGASTKRDSNDVVGMLGLGCKSALTYTNQFALTGIKDGIATQVSISRDEDGAGSMTIVHEGASDEPSGVQITIPTKVADGNSFHTKARQFFRFWKSGTVLVNGEEPVPLVGHQLTDGLLISDQVSVDTVVMGNVPYPMDNTPYHLDRLSSYRVVAFVEIGAVNFTPSREALQDTPATEATRSAIKEAYSKHLRPSIQKQLDKLTLPSEAIKFASSAERMGVKRGDLIWKGEKIPSSLERQKEKDKNGLAVFTSSPFVIATIDSGRKKISEPRNGFAVDNIPVSLFFDGFSGKAITPYKKQKLTQYLNKNDLTASYLVFVEDLSPYKHWIDASRICQWDDVNKEKLDRVAPTGEKISYAQGPTIYSVSVDGEWFQSIPSNEMVADRALYYSYKNDDVPRAVVKAGNPNGSMVVKVGRNQVAKLLRQFPHAQHLNHGKLKEWATAYVKSLTEVQIYQMFHKDSGNDRTIAALDGTKLLDPELKKVYTLFHTPEIPDLKKLKDEYRFEFAQYIDGYDHLKDGREELYEGYPLLENSYGLHGKSNQTAREHMLLYLNIAYEARGGK